jgi:competence protein ComFA
MRFVSYFLNNRLMIAPETLNKNSDLNAVPFSELHDFKLFPANPLFDFDEHLQQILFGKMLLFDELPFSLESIHEHYENGYVRYHAGIQKMKSGWKCNRCGNSPVELFAAFSCFRCKSDKCVYCRHCIMMGRVSLCTPLLSWTGPVVEWDKSVNKLVWEGELSSGQKVVSDLLVVQGGLSGELLIWAVCGAGKTEVLFRGIEEALKQGLRICVATPRTDVALELTPRFRTAFPFTLIASCYGGSVERDLPAQLVISTTHQLYRFKQAFDIMIVDEVDAFPYSFDERLQYAVSQAVRPNHASVYLSATPSRKMKKAVSNGEISSVKIPMRFHGYPLPVPKMVWLGEWKKRMERGILPDPFLKWVKSQAMSGRRAMIFVPSVLMVEKVKELIKRVVEVKVDSVHAEDPRRKEKVEAFREGDVSFLVTTTILERGVTVPFLDVTVFGADHHVFTESALVQMSGRAGRSKDDHNGKVLYFHYGKSLNMVRAVSHIRNMNKEAGL